MNIQKLAAVLLASTILPAISLAATPEECNTKITEVSVELNTEICALDGSLYTKLGKGKNGNGAGDDICLNLRSKLNGAMDKLDTDKLVDKKILDAGEKLDSFQNTIYKLAFPSNPAKYVITTAEYDALYALWRPARDCVDSLLTP